MVRKTLGRVGLALVAAALGVGLTAVPATADDRPVIDSHDVVTDDAATAPEGVAESEWFSVLEDAKAEFGNGDKAELEALLEVAPLAVSYCSSYVNIAPGTGVWYKIPSSGTNVSCVLESGNNSVAVRTLQETLVRCYGRSLTLDGAFGPATYNALMYAQSAAGIAVDGVYGTNTRKNIKWWGGGSTCTKGSALGL